MKFFIDEPKTYLSVNNKGRAMNQWISTFTHVLIPDELSRDAFIESIRAKASMLDEEFPRTKPLRVDVSRNVSIRPRACFSPSYNKVKSQTKHVWLLTLL